MTALFTAALNFILTNPTLMAVIGAVVAALGWGIKQKRAGMAEERAKQAAAEQRAVDVANEVQSDVGVMSTEQVRAELAKRAGK